MNIILDTNSCHYKAMWELFLAPHPCDLLDDNIDGSDLILIDCQDLLASYIKQKVNAYQHKIIFILNASPEQAAVAAATFYNHTPFSIVADFVFSYVRQNLASIGGLISTLSAREKCILALLGQAKSNRDISRITSMPISTVKYLLQNIYRKLRVENRAEAILVLKQNIL